MSNVKVTNLLHGSSASNNITLASDGTTTIPTVKATTQVLVGGVSSTANGGTLQISNGITFPATQSACSDVNTLDDYEEGTWTPTISGATSATYTNQVGIYRKIGSQVFIYMRVTWTAVSGALYVNFTGLPFSAARSYNPCFIGVFEHALPSGYSYVTYYLGSPGSATTIYAAARKQTSGSADVSISSSGDVTLSAVYDV